jgi:hypothetical protein
MDQHRINYCLKEIERGSCSVFCEEEKTGTYVSVCVCTDEEIPKRVLIALRQKKLDTV